MPQEILIHYVSCHEPEEDTPVIHPPPLLPDLPDLALEHVCRYLSKRDLCSLALANRRMAEVSLRPKFFTDIGDNDWIKHRIVEKKGGMEEFLSLPRLRRLD